MSNSSHAFCETHQCNVSTDQTEGQCRDAHRCGDEACPLEKELGRPRFARALEMLAAGIGQVGVKLNS